LKELDWLRDGIDDAGAGLFTGRIPPNVRIFITSRRKIDRGFLLADDRLVEEVNAIPELCAKQEEIVEANIEKKVGVQTRSRKLRTLSPTASTRAKAAGIQTKNGGNKAVETVDLCTPTRPVDSTPDPICLLSDSEGEEEGEQVGQEDEEEDEQVECKCWLVVHLCQYRALCNKLMIENTIHALQLHGLPCIGHEGLVSIGFHLA